MKHFIKIAMVLLTVISFNSYAEDSCSSEGSRSHNTTLGNYQGDNSTGNGGFNDETGSGNVDYRSNSGNSSTNNTKVESSTSGMYGMAGSATTTNLTTSYGQDLCMGSWTAGVSAMGMGISGGSTISDGNCERLRNVKLLNDLGLRDVALSTLCENPAVRAGMKKARPAAYNKLCKMWDEEDDIDDFLKRDIDDEGNIVVEEDDSEEDSTEENDSEDDSEDDEENEDDTEESEGGFLSIF